MSAMRSEDWHEGHAKGYRLGQDDLIEWVDETFREWRELKAFTHEELFALHELVGELRLRQARREH